jgi:nitrile hydratase accessory protein
MTLALHERGVFTWNEWARALGSEIASAQAEGDADLGDTYYRHWLAALESLIAAKGVSSIAELARYRSGWMRAAERTPHGAPIELQLEDLRAGSRPAGNALAQAVEDPHRARSR